MLCLVILSENPGQSESDKQLHEHFSKLQGYGAVGCPAPYNNKNDNIQNRGTADCKHLHHRTCKHCGCDTIAPLGGGIILHIKFY